MNDADSSQPTQEKISALSQQVAELTSRLSELEQALHKCELTRQALFENSGECVCLTDLKGRILEANPSLLEKMGMTIDQLRQKHLGDILVGEDLSKLQEAMQEVKAGRTVRQLEATGCGAGGKKFQCEINAVPLKEDGKVIAMLCLGRDVTEAKRCEQNLRESEQRFRAIVETVPVVTYTAALDETSTTLYVSPQIEKRLGYSQQEYTSDPDLWYKLLHPEDRDRVIEEVTRARSWEEPFDIEYRMIRKDGDIIWFRDAGSLIRDEKGNPIVLQGAMFDITERKLAEEALRESEAKHRTLLENLPQRVFSKDKDSVYVSCNKNFARGLRIKPEELPGKTDYDFFPKDLADKYRADDRKVLASAKVMEIEEEYIDRERGGEKRSVHTVKAPIKDANGNSVGVLGIFWDITDHKRAEEALRNVHLQLMLARDQERRRLAGELHDSIGQGLIALRLLMQSTLANSADLASESQSRDLANAAEKCNDMIKEIRHICYGLHPPILESLGLAASMRQLAKDCLPQLHADFQCPQALEQRRFEPDVEIAFFRIAQEAIHNALDHSHAKNLTIRLKSSKDRLTMAVIDDGVGFDPHNSEGRGLGLSTMAERANAVGGKFTIHSTKNKPGTRIEVKVPLRPSPRGKPAT